MSAILENIVSVLDLYSSDATIPVFPLNLTLIQFFLQKIRCQFYFDLFCHKIPQESQQYGNCDINATDEC